MDVQCLLLCLIDLQPPLATHRAFAIGARSLPDQVNRYVDGLYLVVDTGWWLPCVDGDVRKRTH